MSRKERIARIVRAAQSMGPHLHVSEIGVFSVEASYLLKTDAVKRQLRAVARIRERQP